MIKKAIVRGIPSTYKKCVSNHPDHPTLSIVKAKKQHQEYCEFLEDALSLEVFHLDTEPAFPDSCFVEDTVVIQKSKAIICNFGEKSRRGEEKSVEVFLEDHFKLNFMSPMNTLEGGDVVHFENSLIVGVTQRTSEGSVHELKEILKQPIGMIKDDSIVHLKSYVSYLGENMVLTTKKYSNHTSLNSFSKIIVPESEIYATNALLINKVIVISEGYPKTKELLEEEGYEVYQLRTSEFEKCQGALTCLSVLF